MHERPSPTERADLARLYADWCRADESTPADDPRTAAWNWLACAVDDAPEDAWSVLLEALGQLEESEDAPLGALGADLLEELLRSHGDLIVDRLGDEAGRNPRLGIALRGVWLFDSPIRPRLDSILTDERTAAGERGWSRRDRR